MPMGLLQSDFNGTNGLSNADPTTTTGNYVHIRRLYCWNILHRRQENSSIPCLKENSN
jgi:hypothetical protein